MTFITLYTKRYFDKLLVLLESEHLSYGITGEEYFFSLPYSSFKAIMSYEELEDALENIVLEDNAVIKVSEKALFFVKDAVFSPHRKDILYDIASIIECKGELNIDGYIDFKMQQYSLKIDKILYTVIKRSISLPKGER